MDRIASTSPSTPVRRPLLGVAVVGILALVLSSVRLEAHCQVPCGIYGDEARVVRLLEDAETVAKAAKMIQELAGKNDAQSINQAARWVANKESHAQHIIEVVADYFLAQRVKAPAADSEEYAGYLQELAEQHAVIVAAMKAKQSAGSEAADALRAAIEKMGKRYQHDH